MNKIAKDLLVIVLLLCSVNLYAYDFEVDGIYYNASGTEANVTYGSRYRNSYSGDIVIPDAVTYKNKTYSVTAIGDSAFYNSTGLSSISMPNSIATIGENAFRSCSGLTGELLLPNSVTEIGAGAFRSCSGLTGDLKIPDSVTTIGASAFRECSGFTSELKIPDSVTSIGNYAFAYCSGLTGELKIPDNVTTIGAGAFEDCSNLTSVTIGNGVTEINRYTFQNCSGLTSLTLGDSVNTIYPLAFCYCSGITSINIPSSVTEIQVSAFSQCSALKTLTIEEGNEALSIANTASFVGCPIENLYVGRNISYTGTNSPFRDDNISLTSLTIGGKVTTLGEYEFYGCTGLADVNIPNNVTEIEENAFADCSGLKTLNLEDGDKTLNMTTSATSTPFSGCPIETLHLGRDISYADSYSPFRGNTTLTSLTIGNKVTSIGGYAFYDCTNLIGEIVIPNNVTEIDDCAFYNCIGLKTLTLEGGNETLSVTTSSTSTPFLGCPIETLYLGRNLSYTDTYSPFKDNTSLTCLTIEGKVTTLGEYAFADCTSLKTLNIEDGAETLTIATRASSTPFLGCPIETLHLGRDVSYTDSYSPFKDNTSLTVLTIGEKVTTLGEYEFYGCPDLTGVTSLNLVPPTLYSNTFEKVINVEVPKGVLNTYALADKWVDIPIIYANDEGVIYYPVPIYYEGETAIVASCGDESGTIATKESLVEITPTAENNLIYGLALHNTKDITEELINENYYSFVVSEYHKDNTLYTYSASTENSFDITLSQSGQLLEEITVSKVNDVYYLKVTGDLNGTDILTIRRMSNLRILDIEGANIVKGGECYYSTYETSDNEVGVYFFTDMSSLKQVKLPTSATSIGGYAFNNCSDLMKMTIPNKITSIGSSAFYGCSKLVDITIPSNVTRIYNSAFADCAKLTIVNIADSESLLSMTTSENTVDGTITTPFIGCPIETLYLGRNINYSNNVSPFGAISTLKTVTTGEDVATVSSYAFADCVELTELTIGSNVVSISNNAFNGCVSLAEINSKNPTPPTITSNTFDGVDKEACVLNVPEGSLNSYWVHPYWGEFFNINDNLPNGIRDIVNSNNNAEAVGYYTVDGKKVSTLQRGINIIRFSDGMTRKIIVQ